MNDSLYKRYVAERLDMGMIEDENGFASYKIEPEYEWIYIEDIYVLPEKRREGIASSYGDAITQIAHELGYKKLLGSISMKAKNPTRSMKLLLAYGFELYSIDEQMIYLVKEI